MTDAIPSVLRYLPPGFASSMDFAMYFNDWAADQRGALIAQAIQARFGCCRASAYRWRRAYLDAVARRAARSAA
ncbi:hypothetical protein LQE85_08665 [Stenotrophomonas rhizophila]|uniref:hypothetical protein n=1 Tax=Stenotrophomonas rhizophila TaxID=216778 RepID=UPI00201CE348|nr:hypothetical protein [Stenotrophomonas rhizophila]UQY89253.1 hypothetical protein LQE85_08665 [Stenotrophomonas rhizophila]